MSITNTYKVSLKITTESDGKFESIEVQKNKSNIPEDTLALINKVLNNSLVPAKPPTITTVEIGNQAELMIYNHLLDISKVNVDFAVYDTSNLTNHGDLSVHYKNKQICIEVKNYTKPVPIKEVEKYYKSLSHTEYSYGIMIQMNPIGYAKSAYIRSPIDIKNCNNKLSVFMTGANLDLLYPIINMLIMNSEYDCEDINAELESKRKALLNINEKILELRNSITSQKKLIDKIELMINDIITISSV